MARSDEEFPIEFVSTTNLHRRKGELTMKEFRTREAARRGVTETAIAMAIKRGHYPGLKIRRINQRVVYVQVEGQLLLF